MNQLIKILLAGFAAFMVVAVLQEWEYFSNAWFRDAEEVSVLSEEDVAGAESAVRLMLSLMRHYYASGGDERFVERLPAGDSVLSEMRADIEYLGKNHRRQEPVLMRLETTAAEPLDEFRVEIRTREYWQIRTFWTSGSDEAEPVRSQILLGRYLVVLAEGGWKVAAWEFAEPEEVPPESEAAEADG